MCKCVCSASTFRLTEHIVPEGNVSRLISVHASDVSSSYTKHSKRTFCG